MGLVGQAVPVLILTQRCKKHEGRRCAEKPVDVKIATPFRRVCGHPLAVMKFINIPRVPHTSHCHSCQPVMWNTDTLLDPAMSLLVYSHVYVQQDPRKGTFSTVFLCNNHNLKATLVINGRGDKYILVCSYNGKPNIKNKETIWNEKRARMTGNNMDVLH